MIPPTWCFFMGASSLRRRSTTGMRNLAPISILEFHGRISNCTDARVFPDPVTASTTTSLFPMNNGIVLAWTGVVLVNPMEFMASRIHSDRGGVSASQLRDGRCVSGFDAPSDFVSGAMIEAEVENQARVNLLWVIERSKSLSSI